MKDFLKKSFNREKLKHFLITSTLGNFIGFLAGTAVTTLSTYYSYERRGLRNLFGILPRGKVVVHIFPEWVEWVLATITGFIVMEFVSYFINSKMYLIIWRKIKGDAS